MDQAFEKLKKDGHNGVDDLMKWIKDSKLIADTKEAEDKAKNLFDKIKDKDHVELDKFKEVVSTLAAENKKSMDQVTDMLLQTLPKLQKAIVAAASSAVAAVQENEQKDEDMEKAFEILKQDGYNGVDHIIQWLKDSHLIENTKEAENEVNKLFDKVNDRTNVALDKFQEVVTKLADDNKKSLEQVKLMLLEAIPKTQDAIIAATTAAASAAEEVLKK